MHTCILAVHCSWGGNWRRNIYFLWKSTECGWIGGGLHLVSTPQHLSLVSLDTFWSWSLFRWFWLHILYDSTSTAVDIQCNFSTNVSIIPLAVKGVKIWETDVVSKGRWIEVLKKTMHHHTFMPFTNSGGHERAVRICVCICVCHQ